MTIRSIQTERDYDLAVARIAHLIDTSPAPSTPDGDELDLLAIMVDSYESKRFLMDRPDPIDAIRFRLDQLGFDQKDPELER